MKAGRRVEKGFSLLEVLLVIALLSSTLLPFILMTTQTSQNANAQLLTSSRSLMLNSLMDEVEPELITVGTASTFTISAMDTSTYNTQGSSGQNLPFIRQLDVTTAGASDTLKKTFNFYSYNASTDATSAPLYKTTQTYWMDEFFIDCAGSSASNTPVTDNALRRWNQDTSYDTATKRPGYVTPTTTTTGSIANDIVNTDKKDDVIYQTYRQSAVGANIDYNFDVTNGPYVVKLYFAETSATITDTSPNRRRADIYLEGSSVATSYSPWLVTGGAYRANIQSFNVDVADGVLNVSVRKSATSDNEVQLAGISVSRREMP
jgi:prepilin-type N-terminal cleavage/methylation domain-containing protein